LSAQKLRPSKDSRKEKKAVKQLYKLGSRKAYLSSHDVILTLFMSIWKQRPWYAPSYEGSGLLFQRR